jgi:hypothetical protein
MQDSSNSLNDKKNNQNQVPDLNREDETIEPDFFSQLQQNEKQKGLAARGKGHGWTTFIETLMGDW